MFQEYTFTGFDKSANVSINKFENVNQSNQKILMNSYVFEEKDILNGTPNKRKTLFNGGDHSDLQQAPYKKQDTISNDMDFEQMCKNEFKEQQITEIQEFKNRTFSKDNHLAEQPTLLPKQSDEHEKQSVSAFDLNSPLRKEKRMRKERQEKQLQFIKILRKHIGFSNDIWRKRGFGVLQKDDECQHYKKVQKDAEATN